MVDINVPPSAIGSDRVIAYALIDQSVIYTGNQRLFVDGQLLGPVQRVAICKSLNKDIKDYLILYCDKNWNVLGLTGEPTYAKAVREAERCYKGITDNFIRVKSSEKTVCKWLANVHPNLVCSFCGRLYFEVESMIEAKSVAICSCCIESFAKEINLNR